MTHQSYLKKFTSTLIQQKTRKRTIYAMSVRAWASSPFYGGGAALRAGLYCSRSESKPRMTSVPGSQVSFRITIIAWQANFPSLSRWGRHCSYPQKRETGVERSSAGLLAHLTLLRVLLFQDHKDPPPPDLGLRGQSRTPTHNQDPTVKQSANLGNSSHRTQLQPSRFCRPSHWLLCPATVVTIPASWTDTHHALDLASEHSPAGHDTIQSCHISWGRGFSFSFCYYSLLFRVVN